MQFECNFAGSYTQTSLNHINTTNDQRVTIIIIIIIMVMMMMMVAEGQMKQVWCP